MVGWAPLVVMAVIRESSSSLFSFNFFTRDSIALFENASLSPPCLMNTWKLVDNCHCEEKPHLWHMRLCTIERQASALVGATEDIFCLVLVTHPHSQHLKLRQIKCLNRGSLLIRAVEMIIIMMLILLGI